MPTIRRLFLIFLTIVTMFFGAIYSLAYMVKPKTTELTITIPNDKLNLRPLPPKQPQLTIELQSSDDEADNQVQSSQ